MLFEKPVSVPSMWVRKDPRFAKSLLKVEGYSKNSRAFGLERSVGEGDKFKEVNLSEVKITRLVFHKGVEIDNVQINQDVKVELGDEDELAQGSLIQMLVEQVLGDNKKTAEITKFEVDKIELEEDFE